MLWNWQQDWHLWERSDDIFAIFWLHLLPSAFTFLRSDKIHLWSWSLTSLAWNLLFWNVPFRDCKAGLTTKNARNTDWKSRFDPQRCKKRGSKMSCEINQRCIYWKIKDVKSNIQRCHKKSGVQTRMAYLGMADISAFEETKTHLHLLVFYCCTGNNLSCP